MKEITDAELPKDSEKLGHKFLLDTLRDQLLKRREIEECQAVETEQDVPAVGLTLPEGKKYFRIGEVAEIIGVESYVLRYWETEFASIRPKKSRSGQRIYDHRDIYLLATVHRLMHVEKFSLEGARRKLAEIRKASRTPAPPSIHVKVLKDLSQEMVQLMDVVRSGPRD